MNKSEIIKIAEEIDRIIGKHFWGNKYPVYEAEHSGDEMNVATGIKELLIRFAEEMQSR